MKRAAIVFALLLSPVLFASTPDWVRNASRETLPAYPPETAGVVLLDETTTTVNASFLDTWHRRVVRILGTGGRDLGYAAVPFNASAPLLSFQAWSVAADGREWEVREREAVEVGLSVNALYDDQKLKVIRIPAAQPGTVIAFESHTQQRDPQALQDAWTFQSDIPWHRAKYHLVLPAGWSHDEKWFNAAERPPLIEGATTTWEVADVPAIREEPGRPPMAAIAGRLAINFYPPGPRAASRSWSDFGSWYSGLVGGRRVANPVVAQKVHELTAGRATTLEKIAALAAFAQKDIRYVAIEIGIGGYQPRAASDIFSNRFGDCKDKVTVLSAMLHEIGVDSYYVITTTNRGVIDRRFPSMAGFNHAIIAIRLPDDVRSESLQAIVVHPKLGRLLLFDPTSTATPLGQLPTIEQQSLGLLVVNDGGELLDFPMLSPESSQLRRTARLKLDAAGDLTGSVEEVRSGAIAAGLRETLRGMTDADRIAFFEGSVAFHIANFKISGVSIEHLDDIDSDLVVRYDLDAPLYAHRAGPLVLVRPRVLGHKAESILDLKERVHDYRTDGPSLQIDDIEIAAPATLTVDELPVRTNLTTPMLDYRSQTTFENGVLHYKREYRVHQLDVSLSALSQLNQAFAAIGSDEKSSAVFKALSN